MRQTLKAMSGSPKFFFNFKKFLGQFSRIDSGLNNLAL